jgi:hypothetical protein
LENDVLTVGLTLSALLICVCILQNLLCSVPASGSPSKGLKKKLNPVMPHVEPASDLRISPVSTHAIQNNDTVALFYTVMKQIEYQA